MIITILFAQTINAINITRRIKNDLIRERRIKNMAIKALLMLCRVILTDAAINLVV